MNAHGAALIVITLLAATVNGALGYGFSSITVPLALLILTNRVLNPALVLIEVPLNAYGLFVNRADVPTVWKRVLPLMIGLVPGIVFGTLIVSRVNPSWVKLYTFAALLPLILVQAAGYRRPIRAEKAGGLLFGSGLGVLYSVTTISGPPLALALSNQGLAKREFRAALGLVRLAESTLTAVAYLSTGMITGQSLGFVPFIVPSVAIGVPLGGWIIRRVRTETFRRVCMSFDAWIVAFGVSILLRELHLVTDVVAFAVLATVAAADGCLLYRFFFPSSTPRRTTWSGRTAAVQGAGAAH